MREFFKGYHSRKGPLVSLSLLIDKTASLLAPLLIVVYVSQSDYGSFIYAMTIISLMIPFAGGGLNHSLLYYGTDIKDKQELFSSVFIIGSTINAILILIILASSPWLTTNQPDSFFFLNILTIYIFFQYYHLILCNLYRIKESNTDYSINVIIRSLIFVAALIILVPTYGIFGVVSAYIMAPLYSAIKSVNFLKYNLFSLEKSRKYLKYGLNVGVASVVSQLIILSDNIVIGNLVENTEQLSIYKIATIIPLGLFFIPNVFLTTDFVAIAKMKYDKKSVVKYYMNYLKLFSIISLVLVVGIWLFSDYIIERLFGTSYLESSELLRVLLIGTIAVFTLRNPLGFILNAVGQVKINVKVSYIMLAFNLFLSVFLVYEFGIFGAACATSITLVSGGLITLYYFVKWTKE